MSAHIVHVIPDGPFLPWAVETFEAAAPSGNHFFVSGVRSDLDSRGLSAAAQFEALPWDATGAARLAEAASDSRITIFHSVNGFLARVLADLPASTLRVWSGWGGDYYGSDWSPYTGQLAPMTARQYRRRTSVPNRIGSARVLHRESRPLGPAAQATDVFSAPVPDDLAVFRRRFPKFRGRYTQLNYTTVEDSFAPGSLEIVGDDILVGNSATVTNNHLDALSLLARAGTDGRRVVVPLTYGDQAYAETVVAQGRRLFGDDFVALREYLPQHEYQAIVSHCSTIFMPHRRQQGVGNVGVGLWSGARVILDSDNPLATFLQREGAAITTIRDVSRSGLPSGRMSSDELAQTRAMMTAFWGRDRVIANARALAESR